MEIILDNKKKLNVISKFHNKEYNNDYIIYTDGTKDEDGVLLTYASRYVTENNNIVLKPITSEQEWDMIDKYLEDHDVS